MSDEANNLILKKIKERGSVGSSESIPKKKEDPIIDQLKNRQNNLFSGMKTTSTEISEGVKEEIKARDRRYSNINQIETTLPVISDPANIPVAGEIYSTEQKGALIPPFLFDEENIGIKDIGKRIQAINSNQKDLERLVGMGDSHLYRQLFNVVNYFRELIGLRKKRYRTIHELFIDQQHNISELNQLLVHMVRMYGRDAIETRAELDRLVSINQKEHERRNVLNGEMFPPELVRYTEARQRLEQIDREDTKYHELLREVISTGRNIRSLSFQQRIAVIGDEHHYLDIQNLVLQEDIFELTLYRVMELAYITKLYQQTLDNNERVWRAVHNLSEAVRSVSGGIEVLADYNRQLNESYIRSVGEITDAVNSNPVPGLIQTTNANLRRLVQDVHSGVYGSQISYLTTDKKTKTDK